ncbi:MvaI/BcnI restriction endonuclease family protein, partial [bacterium]|nr:MvaI/BcnI restriction endonuclease family protein [bacterium]
MEIFTKDQLILELRKIKEMGWIKNTRPGNVGGIGNTLEDLLGIKENNLPIPNAAEWELKTQRANTSSLTTLFHMEPSPRALKYVPRIFLLKYGWPHKEAGTRYPKNEMSFRPTISGKDRSDRGFIIVINRSERKVLVSFNSNTVAEYHSDWIVSVNKRIGLDEINPQP